MAEGEAAHALRDLGHRARCARPGRKDAEEPRLAHLRGGLLSGDGHHHAVQGAGAVDAAGSRRVQPTHVADGVAKLTLEVGQDVLARDGGRDGQRDLELWRRAGRQLRAAGAEDGGALHCLAEGRHVRHCDAVAARRRAKGAHR